MVVRPWRAFSQAVPRPWRPWAHRLPAAASAALVEHALSGRRGVISVISYLEEPFVLGASLTRVRGSACLLLLRIRFKGSQGLASGDRSPRRRESHVNGNGSRPSGAQITHGNRWKTRTTLPAKRWATTTIVMAVRLNLNTTSPSLTANADVVSPSLKSSQCWRWLNGSVGTPRSRPSRPDRA